MAGFGNLEDLQLVEVDSAFVVFRGSGFVNVLLVRRQVLPFSSNRLQAGLHFPNLPYHHAR